MTNKSWLDRYEKHVPPSILYPNIPIQRFLMDTAAKHPDFIAISFNELEISYQELNERVNRFAAALQKAGLEKGDRIAFLLVNSPIATLCWEFPYMAAGRKRPDHATVAEAAVREVWHVAAQRFPSLPRFAGGKSFGGRMTSRAHAAEPLAELRGIAFLGFPLHPPDKPGIERAEHLAAATGPLLFLQGTRDELADLALLRPVVRGLGRRATLHVVEGADHGFEVLARSGHTHRDVIDELARVIRDWVDAILEADQGRARRAGELQRQAQPGAFHAARRGFPRRSCLRAARSPG